MNYMIKSIARIMFLAAVFFCGALPGTAETALLNEKHAFFLSAGIGAFYGTAYEIVYKYSGKNEYLSELQWNIKPLLYMGITFNYGLKEPSENRGYFAGVGLKTGIPMQTGIIEDRDWMLSSKDLTHFSSHENHTKAAILVNISTGYSLPLWKLVLKFYLNFDFIYFKWEARNGYTQYGPNGSEPFIPWDPSFPKEPLIGLGITYSQYWIIFNTGIGAEFPIGRLFTLSANIFIGPANCTGIDEHHKRSLIFTDILYSGLYIKPELGAFFSVNNHFDIGLSVMYTYTTKTRGNSTENNSDNVSRTAYGIAGAALKIFECAVTIRARSY